MDQENMRERFKSYLEDTGVTQSFLSKKLEIATDVLSRFKTGQRDLYECYSEKLDEYLQTKGY
jgi:ribosome-binding protein aMBF1 (putative translation factor)